MESVLSLIKGIKELVRQTYPFSASKTNHIQPWYSDDHVNLVLIL